MSVRTDSLELRHLRQISEGNYVSPKEKELNDQIDNTRPNGALATAVAFGALALVALYYKASYHPVLIGVLGAIAFGNAYLEINASNQKRRTDGPAATKLMFSDAAAYVKTCREEKIWTVQQLLVDLRCKLHNRVEFLGKVEAAKTQYDVPTEPLARADDPSMIISREGNQQIREESGKVKVYAEKVLTLNPAPDHLATEWEALTMACRQFPETGACGLKVTLDTTPYDPVSMQKIVLDQ